jgi:hypothetical protein
MRGKRACPTSLHQTNTSTSWVMSDPSVFFPITALVWITDICSQWLKELLFEEIESIDRVSFFKMIETTGDQVPKFQSLILILSKYRVIVFVQYKIMKVN